MPTNKHAAYRYRILNKCFTSRGRKKWTLDALVEEVSRRLQDDFGHSSGISKRTLQDDLNVMRSEPPRGFNAPIVCKQGYYFYADPGYTIEHRALNKLETDLLRDALGLLQQLPGMPQMEALQRLLKRVDEVSDQKPISSRWIQFETNPAVHGLEWLGPLYRSIAEQQVLDILYEPFTEPALSIRLHPYLLKEWRNRWYVFGRTEENKLWNLALDRIRRIDPAPEGVTYQPNDLFDPETWFNDLVGVSRPENGAPQTVLLELSYLNAKYLETRPVHASQTFVGEREGRHRFSLQVYLNHELVNELMRFGKDLAVLEPEELRRMMEAR
ncbi:MAG: WYL domain-containing protein [Saprospiraceae bacterium]|nr:WYL domain-containing protein [Saprospiraceae bacterium]